MAASTDSDRSAIASRFDPTIGALAPAATAADLVRAVPGLDKLLQQGGVDGLVVEGFGLGHVTAGTLDAIKEARRGVAVVLSTGCPQGE